MATSQKRSIRSLLVQAAPEHNHVDAQSIVLNTESLVPFEDPTDASSAWLRTRKWTRLSHLALTGLLLDFESCMLEKEDLRLLQEVASFADTSANECDRLLRAKPTAAPKPPSKRRRRTTKAPAVA